MNELPEFSEFTRGWYHADQVLKQRPRGWAISAWMTKNLPTEMSEEFYRGYEERATDAENESKYDAHRWVALPEIRWYNPVGCKELVLQQLWKRESGEREWRTVSTVNES